MSKQIIVFTPVISDLLHYGHIRMIKRCKELGSYLIVGVGTDRLCSIYKRLPIIPQEQRLEIIESIKYVDKVELISSRQCLDLLEKYDVDIFARGNDRKEPEVEEFMKKRNKKVVYLPTTPNISVSLIIKEIEERYKIRL